MVKVGNRECEFLKLTPLSRSSAMAGALCGVTIRPRRPSGTNRMMLWGTLCAKAAGEARPEDSAARPADSIISERRIEISPVRQIGWRKGPQRGPRLVV